MGERVGWFLQKSVSYAMSGMPGTIGIRFPKMRVSQLGSAKASLFLRLAASDEVQRRDVLACVDSELPVYDVRGD